MKSSEPNDVSLKQTQLFVKFWNILNDFDMFRNVPVNHKHFQSSLELRIAELENLDGLFHALNRLQRWPVNF